MNFDITWKTAAILLAALLLGSMIGVAFDNAAAGMSVLLPVVWYLAAKNSKSRR